MSNINSFLKMYRSRKRRLFLEPAHGMNYNSICDMYKVCKMLYDIDIARSPSIVTDDLEFIDVQAVVKRVNSKRYLIDNCCNKAYKGKF